jgi:serine/threonine protein kinase
VHWNAPSESHSAAHSWHHRYDSRADIWSFGCILYQIAVLSAPFESKSMLALAKKIVEGKYAPIAGYSKLVTQVSDAIPSISFFHATTGGTARHFSHNNLHVLQSGLWLCGCAVLPCRPPLRIFPDIVWPHSPAGPSPHVQVVSRCLSVDVETRPDINGVTRLIAPLLVKEIDRLQSVTVDSSTELQAERSRRRQHQSEAEQHKLTIHSLVRSQSVTLDASSVSCGLQSPTFALGPPEGDGFMSPTRKLEASFQSLASEDPWLQSSESVPSVPATVTTLPASSDGRERQHRRRGSVEGLPSAVAGTPSDPLDNEVAAFATPSPRPPRSGSSRSSRPPSGSSKMVRSGPGRVRSVDPITNMLNQLHKVS